MPSAGHYKFSDLDLSLASLSDFSNVDLSSNPPYRQVLKYNGSRWVPGEDTTGITGTIYSDNIVDGTITSDRFNDDQFRISDFKSELQEKVDEHYSSISGDVLTSNLNFEGNGLKNCPSINGINYIELYNNCSGLSSSLYQALLTTPTINSQMGETFDQFFLNETGVFSKINIDDLASGEKNAKFDPVEVRALPLPSIPTIPTDSTTNDVLESDTLLTAIAKLWKSFSKCDFS